MTADHVSPGLGPAMRYYPQRLGLVRVDGHREAKVGWQIVGDLGPRGAAVFRAIDPAMVLLDQPLRVAWIDEHLVDALTEVRRWSGIEVGAHPFVASLPGLAAISRLERTDRRDADPQVVGVRWVERDRVQYQA